MPDFNPATSAAQRMTVFLSALLRWGAIGELDRRRRIGSFTVGGQIIVSPTLIGGAGRGLILGDEAEVHATGMKEPLRCRQLLGHEDHPELGLGEEMACTTLAEPVHVRYVLLTGKHVNEQMEPATFVALSHRQAVIEARSPVPIHSNLLLRLEAVPDEAEVPEFYAKIIRLLDESGNRCLIHFTSVPRAAGRQTPGAHG